MAMAEDEQLEVLEELVLGLIVSDLFIDGQIRSSEFFKSWHNRKVTLSLSKPLILERFELCLIEEGHATETRSLVEEVKVGIVLRVVFLLLAACISLALLGILDLRRCYSRLYLLFLRTSFSFHLQSFLDRNLSLDRSFESLSFRNTRSLAGPPRSDNGSVRFEARYDGVEVFNSLSLVVLRF